MVGDEAADVRRDVGLDDGVDSVALGIGDMEEAHPANLALETSFADRQHGILRRSHLRILAEPADGVPAYVGLVCFDNPGHRERVSIGHGLAYPVAEIPSRFVAPNPKVLLHLQGAESLFRIDHQGNRRKPLRKGQMGAVVDGAGRGRELLFAGLLKALIEPGAAVLGWRLAGNA